MKILLLSWTPGPKGSWYARHPFAQGAGKTSYRIVPVGPGYIAECDGLPVGEVLASPEDAGWSASRHALHHLKVSARKCPHARALLDAIATASLDALHRSPLGGRARV